MQQQPQQSRSQIRDLADVDSSEEHLFTFLGRKLMAGVATDLGWLRLVKNNDKISALDDLEYQTDFRLELDGVVIGYVDIEKKVSWTSGPWRYGRINIARHPMSHWASGSFNGRPTNKLLSFMARPMTSFWVAVRSDYMACIVVSTADLFAFGVEALQHTRYSSEPLPVYQLPNGAGTYVDCPDAFARLLVGEVMDHAAG